MNSVDICYCRQVVCVGSNSKYERKIHVILMYVLSGECSCWYDKSPVNISRIAENDL